MMREKKRGVFSWAAVLACVVCLMGVCALGLEQSEFDVFAFAGDGGESVGDTFELSGVTYQVTAVSSNGAAGEVQVSSVDSAYTGALSLSSQVVSSKTELAYDVTGVMFEAFSGCKSLTSVRLPATVSSYRFCNTITTDYADACFVDCTALASVEVEDGCGCLMSIDGVLYAKGTDGFAVALLAYPQAKNDVRDFEVPSTVSTVAAYAFKGNTALVSVSFSGDLTGDAVAYKKAGVIESAYVGGIGVSAFEGCTSLTQVSFAQDLKVGVCFTLGSMDAIGAYAFKGCTSLTSFEIPWITTADRKGDAYFTFAELNPGSNFAMGTSSSFTSGFNSYWHNQSGPVARAGLGAGVFCGCSSLTSVVVRAGNENGAMAYWTASYTLFQDCKKLTSLVFEGKQAYWGNPSTSMTNGSIVDIWKDDKGKVTTGEVPTYYYAIDYYATKDAADTDDARGSNRIARVEYAAGTNTAAIATSADVLAEYMAPRSLYADSAADGIVPDPNEAAAQAGLGEGTWIWKLTDTESRRAGLSESCSAYLVRVDDVSAGRIDAAQETALYLACDRNLSRGSVADTAFDAARFATEDAYRVEPLSGEQDPWFSYDLATGKFIDEFAVVDASGHTLPASDYTLSYQRYDSESGALVDATLGEESGAYLVTVTPNEQSGYTGVLQEWILVKNHVGNVVEAYGDTVSTTANNARYAYSQTTSLDFSAAPYAVTVGAGDATAALVAAGYAGIAQGAINVDDTQDANYGFSINPSTLPTGEVDDASKNLAFPRASGSSAQSASASGSDADDADATLSASEYAVSCYQAFERNRERLGVASAQYAWSDTALLVPVDSLDDLSAIAAYAYAYKSPVFFTEAGGSVSTDTLTCLAQFKNVVVAGLPKQFSSDAFSTLEQALGTNASVCRLAGEKESVAAFSVAVARALVDKGVASFAAVSVVDGENVVDSVAALTFSGHEGGVTLVSKSTDDSKYLAYVLHEESSSVAQLMLFGRGGTQDATALASSEWTGNAFGALWESNEKFEQVMDAITSKVNKYTAKEVPTPTPDPDPTPDNRNNKDNTQDGSVPTIRNYADEVVLPADGGAAAGSEGASSDDTGDSVAADEQALTSEVSLTSDSEADGAGDATTSKGGTQTEDAPLSDSVPFLATLGALCVAAFPVLRRCC